MSHLRVLLLCLQELQLLSHLRVLLLCLREQL